MAAVPARNSVSWVRRSYYLKRSDCPIIRVGMFGDLCVPLLCPNVVWMGTNISITTALLHQPDYCIALDSTVCNSLGVRVMGAIWEVKQFGVPPNGVKNPSRRNFPLRWSVPSCRLRNKGQPSCRHAPASPPRQSESARGVARPVTGPGRIA